MDSDRIAPASGRVSLTTEGEGPPLVLIHGVGSNRSIWSRSLGELTSHHAVTTLDLPGFGASPPPESWSLEAVADLVADALEDAVGSPFDLIGSSLGGAVALTLAARRPASTRRLILAAPAGFRPAPAPLPGVLARLAGPYLAARRSAGLRFAEHPQARRALLAGTVADGSRLDPEAARLIWRASESAISLRAAINAAAAADLRPLTSGLVRGERPFGLLWGTLDRVVPAHTAERVLELFPEAPIELVPDAGHVPHLERPREFCQAVARLFEQLP